MDSIRNSDLGDEASFFVCYELFHLIYILSKKAHEYAEHLHIEIEKLAGKIFSDQSWFCALARQKCLWLYKTHISQRPNLKKFDTINIHYTISILKLDQKINNANYFAEWLKNPCELSHIMVLLLVDCWIKNGSITFEDVASQTLALIFESSNFDLIIELVWLVHSEMALILLQKLLAIYPVNYDIKEKNIKFMELLVTCCTHFTEVVKNENFFNAVTSSILDFSNKVFDQLKIVQEENANMLRCFDMYFFL